MSHVYVKATVRVNGTAVAAFVLGKWCTFDEATEAMRSDITDAQCDVIADTVARMKLVQRDAVSVDRALVWADSPERVL